MSSLRRSLAAVTLVVTGAVLSSCGGAAGPAPPSANGDDAHRRLPTGARLDPAGTGVNVGNMPLGMALSPDGRYVALTLNGWRERALQILDRKRGKASNPIQLPSAFLGIAYSPDGTQLAVSTGNADKIYLYKFEDGAVFLADSVVLGRMHGPNGTRYPAGLAWSTDGRTLYIAENLADSLAVVDVATRQVRQRFPTQRYPYGVVVAPNGTVFVSAWGGNTVSIFTTVAVSALASVGELPVGRHPSAMALNADGSRLYVASASTDRIAVVDTRQRAVIATLHDPPPAGPGEGSTPNALALSESGTRLFVAEADNNAVAIFDLSPGTSGVPTAAGHDVLVGRIPVEWYPTALAVRADTLIVVNGKGQGTAPNPGGPTPVRHRNSVPGGYTLGQFTGSVSTITGALADSAALAPLTARVARANGWDTPAGAAAHYPPFTHVIYIIKENRTFDQILSDLPNVDGDTALLFFGRNAAPNHHALAERFGAYDRFFVNAEVSADGHNWSDAAYAPDYVEKTAPLVYADQGRDYDYDGSNRGSTSILDDDVDEPASGYLWDLAHRAGITYRDYGEFTFFDSTMQTASGKRGGYRPTKAVLAGHSSALYPAFDMAIRDQERMSVWLAEFRAFERSGDLPALTTMWLPNDHTSGLQVGAASPRAAFADNDLALGRLVDALSHSRFWTNTVVFVVEDDAQNGPDHVDSHRSVMLAISAYSRPGVVHRFTNTTDVLATIFEILHMGALSQFDFYGRPLRGIFADSADLTPYAALVPAVSLDEVNPAPTKRAGSAAAPVPALDLSAADRADEGELNRQLWRAFKGPNLPYPAPTRMSALEATRNR